ncbi:aspartate aminotransferase [Aspergillus uvarum CBS 121591]|uniref:Aspartate aminotransferase n=1 Tax=Aspergillus uvarum CBS 121591 TaxID=1448315 RepID=A0A319CCH7_9EURO|nr:aspartate aminotransferase [Aspergillus uvarum CBS 121591]PYH76333.1 aspartate aminotransferase [Aspergillus uvarum CBS 121591]
MSTSRPLSTFHPTDLVPPDIQFDVTRRFLADQNDRKINLGQGTYRDENGLPWVLPSVQMAKSSLGDINHEYLPIAGFQPFLNEATKLLFDGTEALAEQRVASCQSLSGTGAVMLIGLTLRKLVNHRLMFATIGFQVKEIPCYRDGGFDFDAYISTLKTAIPGSPIVLHTCAHNPTGCDPTRGQWKTIGSIIKERQLFPIFDSAYLGFNSGSFSGDAWPIRYFLNNVNIELAVCLSMAKNMGLYGERIGLVACAVSSSSAAKVAQSMLQNVQRATITAPPAYGARMAAAVLSTPSIREQWSKDLVVMSSRIRKMRTRVYEELQRLQTPGDWSHVVRQTGMFAYLGISKAQVKYLEENFHVYMVETSRVSIAGLNDHYVAQFAWALDQTVRNIQ